MVALVDPLQHRLRRGDIQRHRHLANRTPAPHREAGVLEHPQHRPIAGHHLRIEAVDPAVRRDLRELLEHPHPDPAALIIISHRKRDLGDTGLAQPVIAGDSHHPTVVPADQRQAINATGLRVRARDSVGAPKPVEAKVTALRRKAVIERLDVIEVHRRRGLQPQRRPIAQQHIPDQRPGLGRRSRPSHLSSDVERPHLTGDQGAGVRAQEMHHARHLVGPHRAAPLAGEAATSRRACCP